MLTPRSLRGWLRNRGKTLGHKNTTHIRKMRHRHWIACVLLAYANLAYAQTNYQTTGVQDNMPVFAAALKSKLKFPMAWTPQVSDLPAWRAAGRAKMWELTLQSPDTSPFNRQVL